MSLETELVSGRQLLKAATKPWGSATASLLVAHARSVSLGRRRAPGENAAAPQVRRG